MEIRTGKNDRETKGIIEARDEMREVAKRMSRRRVEKKERKKRRRRRNRERALFNSIAKKDSLVKFSRVARNSRPISPRGKPKKYTSIDRSIDSKREKAWLGEETGRENKKRYIN